MPKEVVPHLCAVSICNLMRYRYATLCVVLCNRTCVRILLCNRTCVRVVSNVAYVTSTVYTCDMKDIVLHCDMNLRETISYLIHTERKARSRFRFGSPCRFVRTIDILVHIVLPELIEDIFPTLTRYLRSTSPRWGNAWREW